MKILIADDHEVTRTTLKRLLSGRGYDVTAACDGQEALDILERAEAPALAILDWQMPRLDGLAVCRRLRETDARRYVYILMLTGRDLKHDMVEAMQAGVDDYVTKPFDAEELFLRLRAGERVLKLQEDLRTKCMRDELTGALNRRAILDTLQREIAYIDRSNKPAAVILADLDHFKNVNDRFGHQIGDAVLEEAVKRMSATLRPYDVLGRYGGEEFLIVLPGCDAAGAMEVAERVRDALARAPLPTSAGDIPVTVSLGVAPVGAERDADAIVARADKALYRAKASGRNTVAKAEEPVDGLRATPAGARGSSPRQKKAGPASARATARPRRKASGRA